MPPGPCRWACRAGRSRECRRTGRRRLPSDRRTAWRRSSGPRSARPPRRSPGRRAGPGSIGRSRRSAPSAAATAASSRTARRSGRAGTLPRTSAGSGPTDGTRRRWPAGCAHCPRRPRRRTAPTATALARLWLPAPRTPSGTPVSLRAARHRRSRAGSHRKRTAGWSSTLLHGQPGGRPGGRLGIKTILAATVLHLSAEPPGYPGRQVSRLYENTLRRVAFDEQQLF